MAIGKLLISHSNFEFLNTTRLLNGTNYQSIIDDTIVYDCHTSLEDLEYTHVIMHVIEAADSITLIELSANSYSNDYYNFGTLVATLCDFKEKVENFDWVDNLSYSNFNKVLPRETDDQIIWFAGCSYVFGVGVTAKQRFSSIVSKHFQLHETNLAAPGSSVMDASSRLLRSDIRSGDVVIVGLTSSGRFEYNNNWNLKSDVYNKNTLKKAQGLTVDYFFSNTLPMINALHIQAVINFCKKVGAKIIIVNLLDYNWSHAIFYKLDNYINLVPKNKTNTEEFLYLDLGDDNSHPGPKQHRYYADAIIQKINDLKYLKENQNG